MKDEDASILIAVGAPANIGDPPVVILGVTEAAWARLEGGRAQDIDLRHVGVAAIVLVMRGNDHDDVLRQLRESAASLELPVRGLRDLSLPEPKVN